MPLFHQRSRAQLRASTSLSLRWRVMLLAMSMVAMVVILMAVAVYAVISAALYKDIDNQLQSRAQLLIASGSLAADPAKAIEGTAYSDVNAMLVNPGRSIFTANQEGQTLPVGPPEKAVIRGEEVGPCRIRRGDEFQELCELINQATAPLREQHADDLAKDDVAKEDGEERKELRKAG